MCGQNEGELWAKIYSGPYHIFFGHDAKRELQICDYSTGLDSGCCYGKYLTCAIINYNEKKQFNQQNVKTQLIESKLGFKIKLVQVKAKKMYSKPTFG